MRKRISLLLAAVLACTTFSLLGPAPPASAAVTCGPTGTLRVTPGLLHPVLLGLGGAPAAGKDHAIDVLVGGQNVVHTFTLTFPTCVHARVTPLVLPGTGNGVLKGYCGFATGTGTLKGQPFSFTIVGNTLTATGHVVGKVTVNPVPLTGSCLHVEGPQTVTGSNPFRLATGGATDFVVTGTLVGLNCANALGAT